MLTGNRTEKQLRFFCSCFLFSALVGFIVFFSRGLCALVSKYPARAVPGLSFGASFADLRECRVAALLADAPWERIRIPGPADNGSACSPGTPVAVLGSAVEWELSFIFIFQIYFI